MQQTRSGAVYAASFHPQEEAYFGGGLTWWSWHARHARCKSCMAYTAHLTSRGPGPLLDLTHYAMTLLELQCPLTLCGGTYKCTFWQCGSLRAWKRVSCACTALRACLHMVLCAGIIPPRLFSQPAQHSVHRRSYGGQQLHGVY